MNFLRAYLNVFLVLIILAIIVTVPVVSLHIAIALHIVGQNDYIGAAAIGFLSGMFIALFLSPFILWYLDKYL